MKVSVIIPTLNAERFLPRLLDRLLSQTVRPEILIIDSASTDGTASVAERYGAAIRFLSIPRSSFDHGGTRNLAADEAGGDVICFFTQDALPADEHCLERLLSAFSDPEVAAVFGRQIAFPDAPEAEKLTRSFNYPDTGRIWRQSDIPQYGVKAYFFSNVCSAYRRGAFEDAGGFDSPVKTNEDMLMAAKLLRKGYALAYEPDAAVFHSHRFTLREDFRRNQSIGYVMEQYRDRLSGAETDKEGLRLVRYVSENLLRKKQFAPLISFCFHAAARLLGNRSGKRRCRRETKPCV